MDKSVAPLDMVVETFQEALRQAGLDEEGLRLLSTRKEEFCRILIGEIRSAIEAVTNERLRDILNRSRKLEEKFRKGDPEAAVEDAKNLMQDAANAGSSVRERQQRAILEGLIAYWGSVLRMQTHEFILGPYLVSFSPTG